MYCVYRRYTIQQSINNYGDTNVKGSTLKYVLPLFCLYIISVFSCYLQKKLYL